MTGDSLQERIQATGHFLFDKIRDEKPLVYKGGWWQEKLISWAIRNEHFKTQLLSFIDVFPALKSDQQMIEHIKGYFSGDDKDSLAFLKIAAGTAGISAITAKLSVKAIKKNILAMAKHFVVGENEEEYFKNLLYLWQKQGSMPLVKLLDESQQKYIEFIPQLCGQLKDWPLHPNLEDSDYGKRQKANILIKPSALVQRFDVLNIEEGTENLLEALRPIMREAKAYGCILTLETEEQEYDEIVITALKRLLNEDEFKLCENISISIEASLNTAEAMLLDLLDFAKSRITPFNIRLKKTLTGKPKADANFEKLAAMLLQNRKHLRPIFATHNIRHIALIIELSKDLSIPKNGLEFETIYGMAEPIKKNLSELGYAVRDFSPLGELNSSMSYLIQCLLKVTSGKSFLKRAFHDEDADHTKLLMDPAFVEEEQEQEVIEADKEFSNVPSLNFAKTEVRNKFQGSIKSIRDKYFNHKFALIIQGKEVSTDNWIPSYNPAKPQEVVGTVALGGPDEINQAIESCKQHLKSWSDVPIEERIKLINEVADILQRRRYELAAILVSEAGKSWREADGEVMESIDLCKYYALQMRELAEPLITCSKPGFTAQTFYEAKGVGALITPWNFPLATPVGAIAASILAGNCVVFKPSTTTPVIAAHLMQVFKEAHIPSGVINFVPGRSEEIGDLLVTHPDINFIAFTGSHEIGLKIIEKAHSLREGQDHVKTVIAEMGGKNAIIIDEDSDLDKAAKAVFHSAFGFQGQKCSACSRVIVLQSVYEEFNAKLSKLVREMLIGNPEKSKFDFGPVVNEQRQAKLLQTINFLKEKESLLIEKIIEEEGFYVPVVVFKDVSPESYLAQTELFGPILAIIKAGNFSEALEIANSGKYALTGGLFSRNPQHIKQAYSEFKVGNLHINKQITGGRVGENPFGGFKLSGTGFKVGGKNYLLQFLQEKTVAEDFARGPFLGKSN